LGCPPWAELRKTHDLIYEEIKFRHGDIEGLQLPKHDIMITCHKNFDEGI